MSPLNAGLVKLVINQLRCLVDVEVGQNYCNKVVLLPSICKTIIDRMYRHVKSVTGGHTNLNAISSRSYEGGIHIGGIILMISICSDLIASDSLVPILGEIGLQLIRSSPYLRFNPPHLCNYPRPARLPDVINLSMSQTPWGRRTLAKTLVKIGQERIQTKGFAV